MTDTITLPRSVVERALKDLQSCSSVTHWPALAPTVDALRAALEQPQGKQEPVAVIGDVWTLHWDGSDPIAQIVKKHGLKIGDKLYTQPQNLRCKSTQARLATLWGYEKPQPQVEQEPICWVTGYYGGRCTVAPRNGAAVLPVGMALFNRPQPPRQPLTDEWVRVIYDECDAETGDKFIFAFARAIERAHGIGGEE